MHRYRLPIALAMLGWSSAGMAVDAFGITLHQPLVMQECQKRLHAYLSNDEEQCYKWPDDASPSDTLPKDGQIIVNIPRRDRPDYMSGSDVMVGLKGGLVVSLSVKTHSEEENMHDSYALKKEFGEPSYDSGQLIVLDNGNYSWVMRWQLPDHVTVYYSREEWSEVNGFLRVQWPTAYAHETGVWD